MIRSLWWCIRLIHILYVNMIFFFQWTDNMDHGKTGELVPPHVETVCRCVNDIVLWWWVAWEMPPRAENVKMLSATCPHAQVSWSSIPVLSIWWSLSELNSRGEKKFVWNNRDRDIWINESLYIILILELVKTLIREREKREFCSMKNTKYHVNQTLFDRHINI